MTITRLEIANVRNLQSASLSPDPHLNLITGLNGSGKTSLLEAIYLLGMGRSFRPGRARRIVNDCASFLTVFARFEDEGQAGIQRTATAETELRLNGKGQVTLAEMASRLPLVLIEPASFALLDEGSRPRRAQLDWGVFHVEQGFYLAWLRYQRALKQRNSLLRSDIITPLETRTWNKELAESAAVLHGLRQRYMELWRPYWKARIEEFLPGLALELEYQPGWDTEQDLAEVLSSAWNRDRERGYTQAGPHRADLRVKLGTAAADEVLSRGQKKLAVCALKLSQVSLLAEVGRESVLLIDDLASELDSRARSRLVNYLAQSGAQVFITLIELDAVSDALEQAGASFKVFHVEHGIVTEATSS